MSWPDRAAAMVVTDDDTYRQAAELLKGIKALRSRIAQTFGPIGKAAHAAWRTALAQRKEVEQPLVKAEAILKSSMREHVYAQEEAALAAQRKQQEEHQRQIDTAAVSEHAGLIEGVDAMQEAPVGVPPPAPQPTLPKIPGISQRKVWQAQVTELDAFVKHVAAHPAELLGLLKVDQKALNDRVRVLNGTEVLPGVWISQDTVVAASGR